VDHAPYFEVFHVLVMERNKNLKNLKKIFFFAIVDVFLVFLAIFTKSLHHLKDDSVFFSENLHI
jgi:hypothetical protein